MSQSSQSHPIRIPHGVRQICPLLLAERRTCSVTTLGCGNDALATSNHVIPPTSSLFGGHDRLPTFLVHIPHTSFVAVPNAALLALPGGLLFGSSFPPLFSSHSTTSCQDQFAVLVFFSFYSLYPSVFWNSLKSFKTIKKGTGG